MKLLPYSFGLFTLCGLWRPVDWSIGWKRILYDFYTFVVLFNLYSFGFMQLVDAILSLGCIEDLISSSFMLLTVGNDCCKAVNMLTRREDIMQTFGILNNDFCATRSVREDETYIKFNMRIRKNFICYVGIVGTAVFTITLSSIVKNIPERTLPFKAWVPLNYSRDSIYWYFYLNQVIAHGFAGMIGIAYDTMVPGIMLLTCAQLEIFQLRLGSVFKRIEEETMKFKCVELQLEQRILKESVCHHRDILQFAEDFNDYFASIILVQYLVSSFVICMSAYRLVSMEVTNPEYPFAVVYILCMMVQVFYYCWYGNEVIITSSGVAGAIYQMDWTSLHIKTQKNLIMIMNRSERPIVFTSGKILVLSLESFMRIMKLSYTAFNVLKQT